MGLNRKVMNRPPDQEKWEFFAQGYGLPMVVRADVTTQENDRAYRVYGRDGEISFIDISGSELSLESLYDPQMKVLMDLLTEQNPDDTSLVTGYYPDPDVRTHFVRLLKSDDKKRYVRAELFANWHTALQSTVGTPGAFGTFTQRGEADVPYAIMSNSDTTGIAILTDLVKLVDNAAYGSSNLGGDFHWYKPTLIPGGKGYENSNKYAMIVELQRRDRTGNNAGLLIDAKNRCKLLKVRQNMVQIVGAGVVITDPGSAPTGAISGTLGSLAAGTWNYKYTIVDSGGNETNPSASTGNQVTTGTTSKVTLTITRDTTSTTTSYKIYRATGVTPGASDFVFLGSIAQPGTGATFTFVDDGTLTANPAIGAPTANLTGQGKGRVVLTPADFQGTGWNIADGLTSGGTVDYHVFVHYLYQYLVDGTDTYLVDDGLNRYKRWDVWSA